MGLSKRSKAKKMGYDSGWEMDLALGPLKGAEYHPDKIEYTIPARVSKYEPDFYLNGVYIEAKGRFRPGDPKKYKLIHSQMKEQDKELVFVFQKPELPLPGAQKRKDGSKRSHQEWADSIGAKWYTIDTIKEIV